MVLQFDQIPLVYTCDYSDKSPIPFEVSEDLIDELERCGELRIKFDPQGVAYLGSKSQTYQIRRTDNSNTMLLVSLSEHSNGLLESRTDGLVQVEKLWCTSIPDAEVESIFDKYQGHDIIPYLSYHTIWSETELLAHLRSLDNYYLVEGRWMRVPDDTLFGDMDALLNLCAIIGGGKEFNSEDLWIQFNDIAQTESMSGSSLTYVQYLLSRLSVGSTHANKGESDWPLLLELNEEKIILFRGQQLLFRAVSGSRAGLPVADFVSRWREILETTAVIESYMLDDERLMSEYLPNVLFGRAVISDNVILPLDARLLSVNPLDRVEQLFKVKPIWRKDEFEGYISPLLAPGSKPESILLKSCRLDEEADGTWYYSSKF
jgi:hypothetical protein